MKFNKLSSNDIQKCCLGEMLSCSNVFFLQTKTFGKKFDLIAKMHKKSQDQQLKLIYIVPFTTIFNVWNEIEPCLDVVRTAKAAHIETW